MSIGLDVSAVVRVGVMEGVGGAKVCELLEEVKRDTPLSGVWDTGYAECICAGDVADDSLVVSECNDMAGRYDVMYTYEGCTVSIGDYGEWIGSNVGCLFDGFRFHVTVADRCSWWGWADVRFPFGGGHKETTGGGCQHCATVKDRIAIVWGCMDILDDCLCASVTSPWRWWVTVVRRVFAICWCWRWRASPREV